MAHKEYCDTCSGIGHFNCPVCDGEGMVTVGDAIADIVDETNEQLRKRELKMLADWKAMAEDILRQYPTRPQAGA